MHVKRCKDLQRLQIEDAQREIDFTSAFVPSSFTKKAGARSSGGASLSLSAPRYKKDQRLNGMMFRNGLALAMSGHLFQRPVKKKLAKMQISWAWCRDPIG